MDTVIKGVLWSYTSTFTVDNVLTVDTYSLLSSYTSTFTVDTVYSTLRKTDHQYECVDLAVGGMMERAPTVNERVDSGDVEWTCIADSALVDQRAVPGRHVPRCPCPLQDVHRGLRVSGAPYTVRHTPTGTRLCTPCIQIRVSSNRESSFRCICIYCHAPIYFVRAISMRIANSSISLHCLSCVHSFCL